MKPMSPWTARWKAAGLAAGLTAVVCAIQAAPAGAEPAPAPPGEVVYVVVAAASPVEALDGKDLFDVYTGRLQALPGTSATLPIEQPRGSTARELFYGAIGAATPAQIDSHWARLQFSGRLRPPQKAADEADVVRRLKADPQSIGYLATLPKDAGLRVVLRLNRRPASG